MQHERLLVAPRILPPRAVLDERGHRQHERLENTKPAKGHEERHLTHHPHVFARARRLGQEHQQCGVCHCSRRVHTDGLMDSPRAGSVQMPDAGRFNTTAAFCKQWTLSRGSCLYLAWGWKFQMTSGPSSPRILGCQQITFCWICPVGRKTSMESLKMSKKGRKESRKFTAFIDH